MTCRSSTGEVTVLWALRSPCNLGCTYCYFGTLEEAKEEARSDPVKRPGQLTHLPHGDLHLADITRFLSTIAESGIKRVFLAGGEPLIWPPIGAVIRALTAAQIEVTVCTNGIPLNRPEIRAMLLDAGVSAVSVSLDSADAGSNDQYRPARNRKDGWATVVSGIRALITDRAATKVSTGLTGWAGPRIGLYSVITRRNVTELPAVARFAAELGLDYFVPQPISLARGHHLDDELTLRQEDIPALQEALSAVYDLAGATPLALPAPDYSEQIESTVRHDLQLAEACFGGDRLAFIQPDGSVWDCPSSYRIADTAARNAQRSITTHTAAELFPPVRTGAGADCPLFSRDCVSMWPLVNDFDRFTLTPEGSR